MIWQSTPEFTTSYIAQLVLALVTGGLLGFVYYGGLWWTVSRLQSSLHPGLLFATSFLVRTALVIAGLLFMSQGDWLLIVVALIPFIVVRIVLTRRWGPRFET